LIISSVPVSCPMTRKIKYEKRSATKPPMAYVNVFLAPSTAFGSPAEVRYLNPEVTRRINKAIAPNAKRDFTTDVKIISKLLSVGGSI